MLPFLAEHAGNPSGAHGAARARRPRSKRRARPSPARCGCRPHEIVFTGGGSEGDNLAIKGAAWAARARIAALDGVVTTGIEHKAVLGACGRLEREGFRVATGSARTPTGVVDLDALAAALDERTAVVSVMLVNNETGVASRSPRSRRSCASARRGAVLHTDAVQAPQWLDLACRGRGRRPRRDLRAQVRRSEGCRRARRARRRRARPARRGRRSRSASLRAGTQNVAGHRRVRHRAASSRDEQRAEETARIAALRDRLAARARRVTSPGFDVNGDPDAPRRRASCTARSRRRSRDAARRARPAGRATRRRARRAARARSTRRTCCSRWACRATRARVVGPVLASATRRPRPTSTPRSRVDPRGRRSKLARHARR